jgi:hypothetical protein
MVAGVIFITGLCFLIVLSIIDLLTFSPKSKGYIPSSLTTIFLILAVILAGEGSLFNGVIISLIALFFAEQEMFGGIADLKVLIASGILFPTLFSMLAFATIVTIVAVAVKAFIYFKITKGKKGQFPFILVILVAYIIGWMLV